MAGAEHTFQAMAIKLAAEVIAVPHRIRAFDRSRDQSGTQHLHESGRGVRKGTPDTELICAGRSVNVELKKPGTRHLKAYQPSEAQKAEMRNLRAAGAYADVAWSLTEVVGHWRAAGVPLSAAADALAEARDRSLMERIANPKKVRKGQGFGGGRIAKKPTQRALRFDRIAMGIQS